MSMPYDASTPYGQGTPYTQHAAYNQQGMPYHPNQNVPYTQGVPYHQNVPYTQGMPAHPNQNMSYGQYQPMPYGASAPPPQYQPQSQHIAYAAVPTAPRLGELKGVVVGQKTQKAEAILQTVGVPYEAENKYRVAALPAHHAAKTSPDDANGWAPKGEELEQLDSILFAHEDSDKLTRTVLTWLGCKRLRPLTMRFSVAGGTGDVYLVDRPFKLGGWCCSPLEMTVSSSGAGQSGQRLGRVREDFSSYFSRCFSSCCLMTTYTDIERAMPDGSYEKRYSLRTNIACCGRVDNCCGATCFKNDAVYDILDTNGQIVAHLQQTYGGDGSDWMSACCRSSFGFTNYVLEFPRDSTAEDRVLLLTAIFSIDYQHFDGGGE